MDIDLLLLETVSASEEGLLHGRTRLQKIVYFLRERLKLDIHFAAHYYGPYSPTVSKAMQSLVSRGFVEEDLSATVGEYTYRLTEDGSALLRYLSEKNTPETEHIRQELDSLQPYDISTQGLSVAAKLHFLLSKSNRRARSRDKLQEMASTLNWRINGSQLNQGVAFLVDRQFAKELP